MEQITLTIEKNSGLSRIADAYLNLQANNHSDPRLNILSDVTRESFSYNQEALREFVSDFPSRFFPLSLTLARYYRALKRENERFRNPKI